MPTVPERVAAGVAWLDANHPGWVARVNPGLLRMSDCARCVLGQLFGNYNDVAITFGDSQRYGFDSTSLDPIGQDREFLALDQAWRAWFQAEARRRESACCPCRGLLCDPDCACPECPHREEDLTDDHD